MSSFVYSAPVPFTVGSFDYVCNQLALPLCTLVGDSNQEPLCYSRNIEIAGTLIFEPATLVIHIIALVMTAIMIFHIKSKYTAVGRKEIVLFFYLYAATTVLEFFVVSGIIPSASSVYPYFVSAHLSLSMATLWSLFVNGFVPFQWIEDGTALSLWALRISSFLVMALSYFISIATFQNAVGFSKASPNFLWIWYFIFCAAFVVIYIVCQVVVVLTTLEDSWPLADVSFGVVFFLLAQMFNFVFSVRICDLAKHYVDGMFFGTIATLLAVMMVYKYWDSVTKEDLEFSVGGKINNWEINDPLLGDSAMAAMSKGNDGYPDQSRY
ncbi:chitin synthase III catalytic subunit [Entophlyctis helioformis]|nr:chitin synthase III catalytic subunit [Entophlyctis helioformis]